MGISSSMVRSSKRGCCKICVVGLLRRWRWQKKKGRMVVECRRRRRGGVVAAAAESTV